ncbi:MAG: response regulator, partial [Deltaproteobacteria bacterium]|nr:response regulator [Deltaproteobacteria bacterium]
LPVVFILIGIIISAAGMHQANVARGVSKSVFKAAHLHNWFWTDGWFDLLMDLSRQTVVGNEIRDAAQLAESFRSSREMTETFSSLRNAAGGVQEQNIIERLARVCAISRIQAEQIVWITKRYSKLFPEFSVMMKCTDQGTSCSKEAIELVSGKHWYKRSDDFKRIYKKMQTAEAQYSDMSFQIAEKAVKLFFVFFTLFCLCVGLFFFTIIRFNHNNSQKKLQKANRVLGENRESLQHAQAIAHIGSWEWNLADGIVILSDEMYRIYGIDKEKQFSSINDLIEQAIHPADKNEGIIAQASGTSRTGKDIRHTYRILHRDGEVRWIYSMPPKIIEKSDDGTPIAMIGTIQDITERHRMEEIAKQTQKMEAIGTLAGGIAHDFNNILTAIIGYAELANNEVSQDSSIQEYLSLILKSSDRAKELVKQILTFSRKRQDERKTLQLSTIIKEATKLLRSTIPTTIEINQIIDESTGIINADPTQMHQIVMNLCTNAAYAMQESGGVLEITLSPIIITQESLSKYHDVSPGPFVELKITDSGIGIEPRLIHRIFEPFFTTKEMEKGTGMGLAVVHGIVKDHGGNISVDSRPGKGTTFTILLPQVVAEPDNEEAAPTEVPTGNEHILLVDDEKTLKELGGKILGSLGYQVTAFSSSIEAFETFRQSPDIFDMVISDQTMPHMTGYSLSKRILEIKPELPVIICTGYSDTISTKKTESAGIKALIYKPIHRNEIARTIRAVLDNRKTTYPTSPPSPLHFQ